MNEVSEWMGVVSKLTPQFRLVLFAGGEGEGGVWLIQY